MCFTVTSPLMYLLCTSVCLGSLVSFCCQVSPKVLSEYQSLPGGVTPVFCWATGLLPSASDILLKYLWSVWGSLFVFHCHESLMYLPSTFNLPGESRHFLLPDVSKCTVRVPTICLGELHLPSAGFGLSSVDPAPEQVSSSRRAKSFVAKYF